MVNSCLSGVSALGLDYGISFRAREEERAQGRQDVKRTFGRAYEVSVVDGFGLYVGGDVVFTTVFRLRGFRIWVEVWVCV